MEIGNKKYNKKQFYDITVISTPIELCGKVGPL